MKRRLYLMSLVVLLAAGTAVSGTGNTGGGGTIESGFLLGGTAQHAQDPENAANDVIKIDTTSPDDTTCNPAVVTGCLSGTVSRKLNVKIEQLDNMVEFKAYFGASGATPTEIIGIESVQNEVPSRGCGGGSPRIQLEIDLNGDGIFDGNAFGNYGPLPFGGGCPPPRVWHYEDLTDVAPRWDITQLTGVDEISLPLPGGTNPFLVPWDLMEQLVSAFPAHKVCSGALVDDSGWFAPAEGVAYYDLISIGRKTWVDRSDTAGLGFAKGCGTADHPDDDHDGDCDRDHDHDEDDEEFDRKRQERWRR